MSSRPQVCEIADLDFDGDVDLDDFSVLQAAVNRQRRLSPQRDREQLVT